jgi:hypothetical protein
MFKFLVPSLALWVMCQFASAQNIRIDYSKPIKFSGKTGFPTGSEMFANNNLYLDKVDRKHYFRGNTSEAKKRFMDVVKLSDNSLLKNVQYYGREKGESGHTFTKRILLKNSIIFLFEKSSKKMKQLSAKVYDLDMVVKQPLQVIMEFPENKTTRGAEFFIFRNYDDESIFIGTEFPSAGKGSSPYVDYKMLKDDLRSYNAGKFELPYVTTGGATVSRPSFIAKGDEIYFTNWVTKSEDEKKQTQKGESYQNMMLSHLDAKTATVENVKLFIPGKNMKSVRLNVDDKGLWIMGLYSVYENNYAYPDRLKGFFSARLEDKNFRLTDLKTDTVSDDFVKPFNMITEDQELKGFMSFGGTASNMTDKYEIYIEDYDKREDGGFDLFVTSRYQYYIQRCDKYNNCTYTYYSHKKGIGYIRTNATGKVVFANSQIRARTYLSWYVDDVVALHTKDNLLLFYNTCLDYEHKPSNNVPKVTKNSKLDSKLEFTVINEKSPSMERIYKAVEKNPAIGSISAKFSMQGALAYNNMVYNTTTKVSKNPIAIIADILILPIFVINSFNPIFGNLGAKGKYYVRTIREI